MDVTEKIKKETGIPTERQVLVFDKMLILSKNQRLDEYGFGTRPVIHLNLYLKGEDMKF